MILKDFRFATLKISAVEEWLMITRELMTYFHLAHL